MILGELVNAFSNLGEDCCVLCELSALCRSEISRVLDGEGLDVPSAGSEYLVDELYDDFHLSLLEATGSDCRGTDAET